MKSLDPASLPTIWLASYARKISHLQTIDIYMYVCMYVSIEGRIETVAKFLYFVETVNQIRSKNSLSVFSYLLVRLFNSQL